MNTGKNKICLLVDDDEDDREFFCLALSEADETVRCIIARDGLEALTILADESLVPDFIFLDLNMPLMDGKECLKEIRKRERLNQVPVVIFTTSLREKDVTETQELGASSFLTKPPSVATLAEKLSQYFSKAGIR